MIEENKRQRIFEAALKLFVENGIDNTTTSLISKEAGVATGTLYLYFKNKTDLINELNISLKQENLAITCKDISTVEISYESLKKTLMDAIEWGVDNPDKFRFIMQFHSSPYYTEQTKAKFARCENMIVELINNGIKKGIKKKFTTKIYYKISFSPSNIHGGIYCTNTTKRKIFWETFFDGVKINE